MWHAPRHQIRNGHLVQIAENLSPDFFPEGFCRIVRTSPGCKHAIVVLIAPYRMFNRRHYLGDFYLSRLNCKKIAATRPPHALHEPRLSELGEHLLKV